MCLVLIRYPCAVAHLGGFPCAKDDEGIKKRKLMKATITNLKDLVSIKFILKFL